MTATKRQSETMAKIENLLGIKLSWSAIKRNVVRVEITDTADLFRSKMYADIEGVCLKYGLAKRVECCGYMAIALVLKK